MAYIFLFKAAEFFILIEWGIFLPLRAEIRSATPMPLLFTPIPAKINNPFTSFIFPHRSTPLDLFSADPIPIPCESKGDGESGQAALYFYREQSCREGTYIAALSLYRAK